jgi:hypothetical protein
MRFANAEGGSYIEMLLNPEGTIERIGSTLSEQELKMLWDNIEALLIHDQKETVGQTLCFSRNLSVQGSYRVSRHNAKRAQNGSKNANGSFFRCSLLQ